MKKESQKFVYEIKNEYFQNYENGCITTLFFNLEDALEKIKQEIFDAKTDYANIFEGISKLELSNPYSTKINKNYILDIHNNLNKIVEDIPNELFCWSMYKDGEALETSCEITLTKKEIL